ncbi:MAG TPA: (Fe-S)-binding protein [Spirochaetota bacterium]|nr:(Fe-S)-binding protein [Spirochaetota bacterium]HQF07172.1 (Fe-S)-binding protein [Spirochaetota bacterium]HQH96071.1 (Fe-S)-binding protein [Spirochaetota bacterium]HQJ69249.1 (Fe-S)-binding protein [Spirochaetota bacterium]HRS76182.1 (Fe-S)-binding protein [Spirochaetota bacterium]
MTGEKRPHPFTMERPPAEGRAAAFMSAFAGILRASSYRPILDLYSRITLHCSRCSAECMLFEASGDPVDNPCYRSSILLRIYRRHFTPGGRLRAKLTGGMARTERDIDEMTESYYHCTTCGRCTRYCPFGIDHRLIVRLGRYILSEIGIVPKNLSVSTREQLEGSTRNTSGLPLKVLRDNLAFLEEEIRETKGVSVRFPMDVPDAEYVFFAPVSDYIMEADTLMGIACVLHEAGISWTIASGDYDAINYGLFYNDARLGEIIQNMIREVRRLNGKKILMGECGHAYRSMRGFLSTYDDGAALPVVHVLELTSRLIEENRIELDREAISEKVTYHDPCNIARSGWIVDQPRKIIRSFIRNFREMDHPGRDNYCCGGGGGTVTVGELKPYRMDIAGKRKAEQLKQTGADTVIAPCANCKKQIRELITHYKLPMNLAGMHDLIFTAIKMKRTE